MYGCNTLSWNLGEDEFSDPPYHMLRDINSHQCYVHYVVKYHSDTCSAVILNLNFTDDVVLKSPCTLSPTRIMAALYVTNQFYESTHELSSRHEHQDGLHNSYPPTMPRGHSNAFKRHDTEPHTEFQDDIRLTARNAPHGWTHTKYSTGFYTSRQYGVAVVLSTVGALLGLR